MHETHEIIKRLNNLANDTDRVEELLNEPSHGEKLSLIRRFVEECPEDISEILQTISTPELRSHVMTFYDKKTSSPLDTLNPTHVPAVLKLLTAKDRLKYIRSEDSSAKEFGKDNKYKFINNIIACDLYIEHLKKSLPGNYLFFLDKAYTKLTIEKINTVETARTILENNPESEDTMQKFYEELLNHQALLKTRRDTWLTFFLKCVGAVCSGGLAYHSLFSHTDGQDLLNKVDPEHTTNHKL